jgi:hypothetical protein
LALADFVAFDDVAGINLVATLRVNLAGFIRWPVFLLS